MNRVSRWWRSVQARADLSQLGEMISHMALEDRVYLMRVHLELGRDHRGHACRPVDPGVALVPGEPEHLRHGLGPVDQLALHLLQPQPTLLSLEHLVRGPPRAPASGPGPPSGLCS